MCVIFIVPQPCPQVVGGVQAIGKWRVTWRHTQMHAGGLSYQPLLLPN